LLLANSFKMKKAIRRFTTISILLGVSMAAGADSRMNRSAQDLARHLAPTPPAAKVNPGDLDKLRQRMIALIDALEASSRSNGPGPESLIAKAYDFRDDVPGVERLMTQNAVLNAWREANARGLFNEVGKFTGDVTKGRWMGGTCVFELVVPADVYPPASNQIANLRLVPAETKRTADAALTPREKSFHGELVEMVAEKRRSAGLARFENPPATDQLGRTDQESLELWKKAMDEAGEAGKQKPNLRLQGKLSGTPSHMTAQRWRAVVEVLNNSSHPTEITVDIYLIGHTWKNRDYYLMARSTEVLKLRASETKSLEVFTRAEGSYKNKADDHEKLSKAERQKSSVRYRGYVVVARHDKEVVAFIGSDQRMAEFGNPAAEHSPLEGLPAF
jgi:hypothetical protein